MGLRFYVVYWILLRNSYSNLQSSGSYRKFSEEVKGCIAPCCLKVYPLQWRHNEPDCVSNHQPHDCLLKRYSGANKRKDQSSASLAFVRRIHRWPVNSPHNGPVTRKCFHLMMSSWFCRIFGVILIHVRICSVAIHRTCNVRWLFVTITSLTVSQSNFPTSTGGVVYMYLGWGSRWV